ncbi:hypothetical protein Ahy_A10g047997 isoform C [Arachis hypogaea]|uniref:Uncharacterized protein n=1 Tax=Arachis hypogaea TaxID=3818 RepID=A0A445B411_ARAHY|nr:hypothetical protein Ahy_A10g047997 isoform C [Arachis hypogaea]
MAEAETDDFQTCYRAGTYIKLGRQTMFYNLMWWQTQDRHRPIWNGGMSIGGDFYRLSSFLRTPEQMLSQSSPEWVSDMDLVLDVPDRCRVERRRCVGTRASD